MHGFTYGVREWVVSKLHNIRCTFESILSREKPLHKMESTWKVIAYLL